MDRWDFDCQKCGRNIGDAYYCDPQWYYCSQDDETFGILQKTYPRTKYSFENGEVKLENPEIITPKFVEEALQKIKEILEKKKSGERLSNNYSVGMLHGGGEGYDLEFSLRDNTVAFRDFEKDDEYLQQAGLIKHIVRGRGRGRHGYCFCEKCAQKLKYICSLCGSKLIKVKAEDHPGGHWGIRGGREPAPMRGMFS
jgi:hypothetical protein